MHLADCPTDRYNDFKYVCSNEPQGQSAKQIVVLCWKEGQTDLVAK